MSQVLLDTDFGVGGMSVLVEIMCMGGAVALEMSCSLPSIILVIWQGSHTRKSGKWSLSLVEWMLRHFPLPRGVPQTGGKATNTDSDGMESLVYPDYRAWQKEPQP